MLIQTIYRHPLPSNSLVSVWHFRSGGTLVLKDTQIGCIRVWKSITFKVTIDTVHEQRRKIHPCKTYQRLNSKIIKEIEKYIGIDRFITWVSYRNQKKSIQSAASRCRILPFYLVKRCLLRVKGRKVYYHQSVKKKCDCLYSFCCNLKYALPPTMLRSPSPTSVPSRIPKQTFPCFWKRTAAYKIQFHIFLPSLVLRGTHCDNEIGFWWY